MEEFQEDHTITSATCIFKYRLEGIIIDQNMRLNLQALWGEGLLKYRKLIIL